MFENVLGQTRVCEELARDAGNKELPGSLLFDGPPDCAKLTTALELARALSCTQDGAWNCQCQDCVRHKALSHPDVLIMGPKNHREELGAGVSMLERSPCQASRYFFARAARKLARRFDRVLYDGEEGRLAKASAFVRQIMESADLCMPGSSSDEEALKTARALLPVCAKLNDLLPDATAVFQVRSMEAWARQTPFGKRKTIIIEHADRMLDSSRNALLKILEEPPAHATFILTTSRKSAMIGTILSRVRRYRFIARDNDSTKAILSRVFRDPDAQETSVSEYLSRFRPEGSHRLNELGLAFAQALCAGAGKEACTDKALAAMACTSAKSAQEILKEAAAISANFGSGDEAMAWSFPAFLDAALEGFAKLVRKPDAQTEAIRTARRFAKLSRDALAKYSSYNLNPLALGERLAAAMAEADGGAF
ncbi:MAG TPA: DNA polymerase III [Spirochaetales bacterium]|nr:DNA polymerase III [Spirochaetales bacterium]